MLLPWTQRTLSYRNGLKSFVLTHIGLHGDHLPSGDPHQPSQCSHQLHLDNVVQVHPESCVIPDSDVTSFSEHTFKVHSDHAQACPGR